MTMLLPDNGHYIIPNNDVYLTRNLAEDTFLSLDKT